MVSFPKIILRPHLKTEKPKAFEGGGGVGGRRGEGRQMRNGEDGVSNGGGKTQNPSLPWGACRQSVDGDSPAKGKGKREGFHLPAWGLARTEPTTT